MADEFVRSLAKVVVAQICEDTKFQGICGSAATTLSDILSRYICEIGESAVGYAHHACRTECNAHDVLLAFDDLGVSMDDVMSYVDYIEEAPFPRPIPSFPVPRNPTAHGRVPSFVQLGEEPPHKHIPSWLPALPDKHTYLHTPVWAERRVEYKREQTEKDEERRRAEEALVALHQRMGRVTASCHSSELDRSRDSVEEVRRKKQLWGQEEDKGTAAYERSITLASQSLFLKPLEEEEKAEVVSLAELGYSMEDLQEKRGNAEDDGKSVLETFAEVINAGKEAKAREAVGVEETLPEVANCRSEIEETVWSGWREPSHGQMNRIGVSFNWSTRVQKTAMEARQLFAVGAERTGKLSKEQQLAHERDWAGEETKDEKRRRAEQILEQAELQEQEVEGGLGVGKGLME